MCMFLYVYVWKNSYKHMSQSDKNWKYDVTWRQMIPYTDLYDVIPHARSQCAEIKVSKILGL